MKKLKFQNQKGFTLIELLVVVVIIMTLTTIGVVSYSSTNRSSRNGRRQADIAQIRSALEVYRSTTGNYPVSGTASLSAANYNTLVSTLTSGSYLSTNPVDPINNTSYFYEYVSPRPGFGISTYQVCYYTEPSITRTCVNNP